MSWTLYGNDTLVGAAGLLTGHTPTGGGTWPNDGAHVIGTHCISLDGNNYAYQNGNSTGAAEFPSWTMPSTYDFEVYIDVKRVTSGTTAAFGLVLGSALTTFTGAFYLSIRESGVTGAGICLYDGVTIFSGTSAVALPTTGNTHRYKVRVTPSGSNTIVSPYYSTDGGVTYTTLGIDHTFVTASLPAINIGFYFLDSSGNPDSTHGLHITNFVLQDRSATTATLSGGSVSGAVGVQITTPWIVTLDAPSGFYNIVVTPAGTGAGDTFQRTLAGGNFSTVVIPQASLTGNFYLTPGTAGMDTVSFTTASVLSYAGTPVSVSVLAAATGFTITGPSLILAGSPSNLMTVTPNGYVSSNVVTATPSGPGSATLSPVVLTFTATSAAQTFAQTPTALGSLTYTLTNSGSLTNGSPLVSTVLASTSYYTSVVSGFNPSEAAGYVLLAGDGVTVINPRTINLVEPLGSGGYSAKVPVAFPSSSIAEWDDTTGLTAFENINESASSGSSAPTTAQIVTAVFTALTSSSDFTVSGSFGNQVANSVSLTDIVTAIFTELTSSSNFTTSGSFGKLVATNVDAQISTRSTYAGGAVSSVTNPVKVDVSTAMTAPRALDAIADGGFTLNDALWSAVGVAVGRLDSPTTTSITLATPSTHTLLRSFTIDSNTAPSFRH